MQRFLVLDSFRGLLALALVVHHSHFLRSITELAVFRNAQYFVEFFFALSGFVLYQRYAHHLNDMSQLRRFMIVRTCRVYPLHLLMLLVFIGFEGLKLLLERFGINLNNLAFSGDRAPGEILPNLLLLQAWWPGANPLSFNYPSWIVSVEFYVTLLFGLIALTLPRQSRLVFAAIAALATLALLLNSPLLTGQLLTGLGCFFAGGLIYRLFIRLQHLRLHLIVATALEALVLLALYWATTEAQAQQAVLLGVLCCAAILIFAFEAGLVSRLLRRGVFVGLGKLWFSVYMTHAAVIFITTISLMLIARFGGLDLIVDLRDASADVITRYVNTGSALTDNLLLLIQVAAVLLVSWLTWRYIERPGITLGRRWTQTSIEAPDTATSKGT